MTEVARQTDAQEVDIKHSQPAGEPEGWKQKLTYGALVMGNQSEGRYKTSMSSKPCLDLARGLVDFNLSLHWLMRPPPPACLRLPCESISRALISLTENPDQRSFRGQGR